MIEVGGREFDVAERGWAQAQRVAGLSRWLSKHVAPIVASSANSVDTDNPIAVGITMLVDVLSSVEPESLISLGQVITGEEEEFVKEHFDLEWVVDGVTELLQQKVFARLIQPFFGERG